MQKLFCLVRRSFYHRNTNVYVTTKTNYLALMVYFVMFSAFVLVRIIGFEWACVMEGLFSFSNCAHIACSLSLYAFQVVWLITVLCQIVTWCRRAYKFLWWTNLVLMVPVCPKSKSIPSSACCLLRYFQKAESLWSMPWELGGVHGIHHSAWCTWSRFSYCITTVL